MSDRSGRMTRPPGRIDRLLNRLGSRYSVALLIPALIAVCIGAGLHVQIAADQLDKEHSVYRERQSNNGYTALSDIQRLLLVANTAVQRGEMSPDLAEDFRAAADILYVRADNFRKAMREGTPTQSGERSIAALETIIAIADTAIDDGFPDNRQLVEDLLVESENAREKLVTFLADMRRTGLALFEEQSGTVRRQRTLVLLNLAGLTLFGSIALLLLQREVRGRQARESAEQRVEFLAYFDPLTHLPNRVHFQEELDRALDLEAPLALLFLDLDDFKQINDTNGHAAGDAVLRHTAEVLTKVTGQASGFCARLGGDEFAIIVEEDDLTVLGRLCEKIVMTIRDPVTVDGETLRVGVSIGLATTTQVSRNRTPDSDVLSRIADFALYHSKTSGRGRFTIYDRDLERRFQRRRALVDELPLAIERRELRAWLQPKVNLGSREVFGFEALVRWNRNGEVVSPGDFIQIAEESGLVVDIDRYMIEEATQTVADWNRAHGTEFSVSVNLSALHFNSTRVVEWVQDALWRSSLPPELLTLEITETVEMHDWGKASSTITRLKEIGTRIALDDFGAGFSSLAYLRTTEADELKIDRSLIIDVETSRKARLLLSSVLQIARNLGLCVTVEGVESEAQAKLILETGPCNAQGFLFGRPEPAELALKLATDNAGRPAATRAPVAHIS